MGLIFNSNSLMANTNLLLMVLLIFYQWEIYRYKAVYHVIMQYSLSYAYLNPYLTKYDP